MGLLSLELEKRLRNFSTDEKEFAKDDNVGYDEMCKNINVAIKGTLLLPDAEEDSKVRDVVIKFAVDDGDMLCDSKKFVEKAKESAIDENMTSHKRKRDMFGATLSWMIKMAKNPCNPSMGLVPGGYKGKESGYKDFWSIALFVREARLQKKYIDINDQQSRFHQKKQKMHPSMYEDDILSNRCSKRLLSVVNSPSCQCCKSSSVDECKLKSLSELPLENGLHKQELVNGESSDTKIEVDEAPVEKHVLVGPQFQAEVPIWTGIISESDSKWLGIQIWAPDLQEEKSKSKSCNEIKLPGKGRPKSCNCLFPGSVECCRFHIAENKKKLRHELGLAFYRWKFDRMGEEVSLSWSIEEEKSFKQIIRLNKPFLERSFFPRKSRTELVSYYYNVFLINRRSYQNRVTPKDIDSDDDEREFGSVSEAFGYNAVKVRRSEPLKCFQNEQVIDLD